MTDMQKEQIYRDYHDKIYGYIISKINNVQNTEDLTAEVFVKIYEKLGEYDGSKASLSTWIYTVTRNTLTDWFRLRKQFDEIPESLDDGSSLEDDVCNTETLETLASALE
ncbi:MAG: RNA polymerase sigma factor, partial [Clostridiales bacterium]|nr:RNA polymerase sigma factor [Clostridiales bacterium]